MPALRLLSCLFILAVARHVSLAEEPIRHSFFIAGPTFTGIIDENGKEEWNAGKAGARDGFVLPNGRVLIAWANEVKETRPPGQGSLSLPVIEREQRNRLGRAARRWQHGDYRARREAAVTRGETRRNDRGRDPAATRDKQYAHADPHGAQAAERKLPGATSSGIQGQGV